MWWEWLANHRVRICCDFSDSAQGQQVTVQNMLPHEANQFVNHRKFMLFNWDQVLLTHSADKFSVYNESLQHTE